LKAIPSLLRWCRRTGGDSPAAPVPPTVLRFCRRCWGDAYGFLKAPGAAAPLKPEGTGHTPPAPPAPRGVLTTLLTRDEKAELATTECWLCTASRKGAKHAA